MFKNCAALSAVDFDVAMMAYTYPGIFSGCSNLRRMNYPAELLFVPEDAFRGCSKLSSAGFTSYEGRSAINDM